MHVIKCQTNAIETNNTCNMLQLTQNMQLKASTCTTSVLAAGNKTPLSQSAGSRSASQVGSVASSLDLSIEGLTPNSNTSSQPTITKDKKSKKKKVRH